MFLLGFCVVNAVNDAITFVVASPSLLPFWGNKFLELYTEKKKFCVREMAVEVGFSLVVLGATWGTFEFAYNRYDAINSFLLGLLLAPPVVGYIAGGLILVV